MSAARDLKVCVVGTGHIGLPLAAVLADTGFDVVGYDTNDEFVSRVSTARTVDFQEEGLDALLARHLGRRLTLSSSVPAGRDVYVITVGTPLHAGTKRPDLEKIREAIRQIAPRCGPDPLVILRSTVTVGTTRAVVLPELARHTRRFGLAFCPERTVEGKAIQEMRELPQIVGGLDERSAERAEALFRTIAAKIVRVSSLEGAEMIKLVNNAYRDLTFAFANEVAMIGERMGLRSDELIRAANLDYPRSNVPRPGFVGGPCLEKDALILAESARRAGYVAGLIEAARATNGALPAHVADRVLSELRALGLSPAECKVLISGFAFKGSPPTEDVRGSAAIPVMRRLQAAGVEVWGHDFVTSEKTIADLGARACTLEEGFDRAAAVIIMNNHAGYRAIDPAALVARMRRPAVVFDSWALFHRERLRAVPDIRYGAIGIPFGAS